MPEAITYSVGRHARNHRHDVLVVQMLLNNHITAIGPRPRLTVDGVCGGMTIEAITAYQQREMHMIAPDGIIDPTGRTLKSLLAVSTVKHRDLVREVHQVQKVQSTSHGPVANVDAVAPLPPALVKARESPATAAATPSKGAGHKYTNSPLELPQAALPVNPLTLPALFQRMWPALNEQGSRVMTAQSMAETTQERHCWNYNLGNVKCGSKKRETHLHQYLPNTWEYYPAAKAEAEKAHNANTRWPTAAEIVKKVGKESDGKRMIMYIPPDISCCFLAYGSLNDGAIEFVGRYKSMAQDHAELLGLLNKGDCAGVAKVLKKAKYYTADESKYASAMKKQKDWLDGAMPKK